MASSNTNIHRCHHCQRLSIELDDGQNSPPLSFDDVSAAARDGCSFFKRRLDILKQQIPHDEESPEDLESLEMEIRNEWNDGILVVSCDWVNQDGRDIEAYDDLLAYTDNRKLILDICKFRQ